MGSTSRRTSEYCGACCACTVHVLLLAGMVAGLFLLGSCDSLKPDKREAILLSFEGTVYSVEDSSGIGTAIIDLQQWQYGLQFLPVQRVITDYRGRYRLEYLHQYYPANGPRMSDLILTAHSIGYAQGRAGMYPEPALQFTEEIQFHDFYLTPSH